MEKYKVMVKGIVKNQDKYLVVEKWYDDRIVDPYQWQFIDGNLMFGESPDNGVVRLVKENTGLSTIIDKILYTWSFMVGDVCNIGIAYSLITVSDDIKLSEEFIDYKWITREEFNLVITNKDVLSDIERAELY